MKKVNLISKEIIESNILIAKFIGAYLIDFTDRSNITTKNWMSENNLLSGGQSLKGNGINELRFHESWDWLMPVIKKIKQIGKRDYPNSIAFLAWYDEMRYITINFDIIKLHEDCVKFIKWYYKNNVSFEKRTNL